MRCVITISYDVKGDNHTSKEWLAVDQIISIAKSHLLQNGMENVDAFELPEKTPPEPPKPKSGWKEGDLIRFKHDAGPNRSLYMLIRFVTQSGNAEYWHVRNVQTGEEYKHPERLYPSEWNCLREM